MKAMEYTEVAPDSLSVAWSLADKRHVIEQKMDGTRVLVQVGFAPEEEHIYMTRKGEPLKHSAAAQHTGALAPELSLVAARFKEIWPNRDERLILDGELIVGTGRYHVFDIPSLGHLPYEERRAHLQHLIPTALSRISLVRVISNPGEKLQFFIGCREAGVEGVMLKPRDGLYESGTRSKDYLKVKFVKSADVVVTEVNRPDPKHGTFTFGIPDETGEIKVVGRCSAIGKPDAQVGDVIEINYLYWTGTTTYQPRMMRIRTDKDAADCTMEQFLPYSREEV